MPLAADFTLDAERLKDAISDKTRLIMLNTPNPSGSVLSLDELHTLSDLVENRHIFLISDEVYERHGLRQHSTIAWSACQYFTIFCYLVIRKDISRHRLEGRLLPCPSLTAEFRKIHQFVTFTTHTPTQWALADYMEHHPEHFEGITLVLPTETRLVPGCNGTIPVRYASQRRHVLSIGKLQRIVF